MDDVLTLTQLQQELIYSAFEDFLEDDARIDPDVLDAFEQEVIDGEITLTREIRALLVRACNETRWVRATHGTHRMLQARMAARALELQLYTFGIEVEIPR